MKYNLKKLVFSSSLIGLIALSSCGVNSTEVNKVYSSCNIVNKKLADYNISSDDYKLFIEKLNSFSAKSSANILDKNTNAISPLSLYMNLAMTSTITSGNTYNELINFLDIDYNDILKFTKALYGLSMKEKLSNEEVYHKENLVNSIWISNNVKYKNECLYDLYNYFNASSFIVDYSNKNTSTNISKYISDNTNGLINPNLNFSENTIFTLINSLYASDLWNEVGLSYTKNDYEFKNYDNTTTKKKFLVGNSFLGEAYVGDDYSCVYQKTSNDLKLTFIIPNDNKDLYTIMNNDNLNNMLKLNNSNYIKDDSTYTRVIFPEFESKYNGDLKDKLSTLGVKSLFDLSNDYKLFENDAYASSLIQMVNFKANKKGIEGAAVTLSTTDSSSFSSNLKEFVVNKSFGYVLSDSYGVALFIGVVDNI